MTKTKQTKKGTKTVSAKAHRKALVQQRIRRKALKSIEGLWATMVDVQSVPGFQVGQDRVIDLYEVEQPLVRVYEDESIEPVLAEDGEDEGDSGTDGRGEYRVSIPDYQDQYYEQPMYNAAWPLPEIKDGFQPRAQTLARARVSLCIVHGDNVPTGAALTLTGCGMDMSWDIAQAYMELGYLPPAIIRLPAFAGEGYDFHHARIIEALRKSQRIMHMRVSNDEDDLAFAEKRLIEHCVKEN